MPGVDAPRKREKARGWLITEVSAIVHQCHCLKNKSRKRKESKIRKNIHLGEVDRGQGSEVSSIPGLASHSLEKFPPNHNVSWPSISQVLMTYLHVCKTK